MATIADELEADFADSGSEREEEQEDAGLGTAITNGHTNGKMELDDEDEDEEDLQMADVMGDDIALDTLADFGAKQQKKNEPPPKDMRAVANFIQSMDPILESIAQYQSQPSTQQGLGEGLIEEDPQYKTFSQSNTYSTAIGDRMAEVHKYIRDHYSTRFPELETLLVDALQYTKAVGIIGNGPMDQLKPDSTENVIGLSLQAVLSRPQLMTITVEATTTKGQPLSQKELGAVQEACRMMLRLESARKSLTQYVESRLALFAPNLTTLIGSDTAAHLLNARGGIKKLAETRASNIPSIGSKHFSQSGLATNAGVRNRGYLYESPLIQRFRPELRIQAMRITSAKIVLAVRCDQSHQTPDGSLGDQFREQCEKRLDKLIEPPPNKGHRALPAPDDKPARKRGGRRARKAKEATAMTDIRKAQNRMAFGKEEQETGYGTGDSTKGLGMIGQQNDNRIRSLQVDNRTRAKLGKKSQGWGGATPIGGASSSLGKFNAGASAGNATVLKGHGLRTSGVGTSLNASAGTASSLAFTPRQGLELADPKARAEAERKEKAKEDKWFSSGTFTQVGQPSNGGFKVPSIPKK